jgi:CheY-like chemotaxis protein
VQASIPNAFSVAVDAPPSVEGSNSVLLPRQGRFASHGEFRILLIDDNRDATESMGALLKLMDYDIRTADDAQSGLAQAIAFQPHLVLSDIGLPGMDGYELAPHLRRMAGERKLILAAVTSYGLARDKARAKAAGYDHHFVKPVDADMLLNFIACQFAEY